MTDIEEGNCAYLDNVSLDVAQQFQEDNPHVTVFYEGFLLSVAAERIRERTSCDFDAAKRARKHAAGIAFGTVAHLFSVKASPTIH